jgi:hypothetical protein
MVGHPGSLRGLELIRCSDKAELRRARKFRNEIFRARSGIEFEPLQERRRDESSHVMLLLQHGTPRATARVQPYPGSGVLAEIAPHLPSFDVDSEVGRIAALTSADSARYSLVLLVLGAIWLLQHTQHRSYVAYCHPKLLPLYQLVGARDTGLTLEIPGRPNRYCVLLGDYTACVEGGLTQLASAGFGEQDALASVRGQYGTSWDDPRATESVS